MDGHDLKRRLYQLLNEDESAGWLDERTTFDYLYEAACEFNNRTKRLTSYQEIATVEDQTEYSLNSDFLSIFLKDRNGDYFIEISDGTNTYHLIWKDYEDILYDNNTTSVEFPTHFTILDGDLPDRVTGAATSDGAVSNDVCTLTSTTSDFTDVSPGSIVHNTTDTSHGIVLSKTSTTALVTALFAGTNNDWTTADAFIIQPAAGYKLILDPPPSEDDYTVTVRYVQRPAPVYSDYGVYRFPIDAAPAIIKYAFWLYKYRDREPNFADALYRFWETQIRRYAGLINEASRQKHFTVNLRRRA